jgi:threonine/homoserine/homoserine lactone efflux protein
MADLLLFIPACFALNLAFGPNNLMALTNGAQRGPVFALLAGVGRLLVFAPMIALSALGLGLVLSTSALVFTVIKILGAGYLVWLGVKLLKTASTEAAAEMSGTPLRLKACFRSEALVALGNPKAILIFAAFFPQFVKVDAYLLSYLTLGGVFLVLEAAAILIYALVGSLAARSAAAKLHWFHRGSGVGMILFGLLLLLTKRPALAQG